MNLELLRNQNRRALLACVLLPIAALLGDLAVLPAGMAAIPNADQIFRLTIIYVAVLTASLWLPRWQQIFFVAIATTGPSWYSRCICLFPVYLKLRRPFRRVV